MFKGNGKITPDEVVSRLGVCTVLAQNAIEDDLDDETRARCMAEVSATLAGLRGLDPMTVRMLSVLRCAQSAEGPLAVVNGVMIGGAN